MHHGALDRSAIAKYSQYNPSLAILYFGASYHYVTFIKVILKFERVTENFRDLQINTKIILAHHDSYWYTHRIIQYAYLP